MFIHEILYCINDFFFYKEPHSNKRYQVRTFNVKENSVLHGISGYFDAVLYDDVTLSIEPRTHSPGMISWFPIFFPIKVAMRFLFKIESFVF